MSTRWTYRAIAEEVTRLRIARGWTQADLARRVGVTQQRISQIEQPEGNPILGTLAKVAKALKHDLSVKFERPS